MIKNGELDIAKTATNLDVLNAEFKMTAFEEYNLQEKVKEVRKARKLEIDNGVIAHIHGNLDILHALNRPFRSVQNSSSPHLHYVGGLCDAEEDDITKTKKAQDFIKKIKKHKKEFTEAVRKAEKSLENRDLEDLERLRKKEREEEEQKQLERKRQHEAQMQKMKDYEDERLHKRVKHEEEYVSKLDKKPLYRDIENKFKRGFVIPELEERKKKLAEIRDFHKPIGNDDIQEHKEKVTKLYEEALQKRKEQTEAQLKQQQEKNPIKKVFESPHHKVFAEEVTKIRSQKENERMEFLKRQEKVMELLQEVKDNHVPKADPQKELELMNLVNQLNARNKRKDHRSRTADGDDDRSDESLDPKKIGAGYLQSVKEMVKKKKETMAKTVKENGGVVAGDIATGRDSTKALTGIKSETAIKRKNYLVELRQENKIGHASDQVDNIIKSKKLDIKEKKELLQTEVEKLEEKAKRMELVRKVKHNNKPFEGAAEDDEVDQIYIKAIKAKLEMLGN